MSKDGSQHRKLALDTLAAVAADENAPAAARAAAARTLLEFEREIGRHAAPKDKPDKPLSMMSRDDMVAELAALREARAADLR